MLARDAVYASPHDAAKAYPDLFPTAEAARQALKRAGLKEVFSGHSPKISTPLGKCPLNRYVEVRYRPNGRGQQNRVAWIAAHRLNRFEQHLTALLGTLAYYEPIYRPAPPIEASDKQDRIPYRLLSNVTAESIAA